MKVFFLFLISIFISINSFSLNLGGALSLDYFNNPIVDSAPSPIQQQPILFHSLTIGLFNLRSGFGVLEAYYQVSDDLVTPKFNDFYPGFYTLEFDIFIYPSILIPITNTISIGIAGGGGARLPVLTKVDSNPAPTVKIDSAYNWFYAEYHYIYWGAQLLAFIQLPLSESTKFYISINYKDFLFRDQNWTIGATTGVLWQLD